MSLLVIAAGWLAVGAVAVIAMRRRGHDTFGWAVLFLFLGPLALPLAVSSDRHRPPQPETPTHDGRLDVLVAHDGSDAATAALDAAMDLLGPQLTSITLAAVVDLEATSTVRGRDTRRETQAQLDALAHDLASVTSAPVDTVILFGEPARTLRQHAAEHGYELIVTGNSTTGRARLRRSRAVGKLATPSHVPVLVGPATMGASSSIASPGARNATPVRS